MYWVDQIYAEQPTYSNLSKQLSLWKVWSKQRWLRGVLYLSVCSTGFLYVQKISSCTCLTQKEESQRCWCDKINFKTIQGSNHLTMPSNLTLQFLVNSRQSRPLPGHRAVLSIWGCFWFPNSKTCFKSIMSTMPHYSKRKIRTVEIHSPL